MQEGGCSRTRGARFISQQQQNRENLSVASRAAALNSGDCQGQLGLCRGNRVTKWPPVTPAWDQLRTGHVELGATAGQHPGPLCSATHGCVQRNCRSQRACEGPQVLSRARHPGMSETHARLGDLWAVTCSVPLSPPARESLSGILSHLPRPSDFWPCTAGRAWAAGLWGTRREWLQSLRLCDTLPVLLLWCPPFVKLTSGFKKWGRQWNRSA